MAEIGLLLSLFILKGVCGDLKYDDWKYDYINTSVPLYARQILEFKLEHPKPIGLYTYEAGSPVDIRETGSVNSDLFDDNYFLEVQSHNNGERIPIRNVAAKGVGVWGYFEVTNDVSKYTKADVFNGVGKTTQAFVRFSVGGPESGGPDLNRDFKAKAVKLYTKHGILDILNLNTPTFATKDPRDFFALVHSFARRNPETHLLDFNIPVDFTILKPDAIGTVLFILSDYGLPNGWQRTDFFPIHTYELVNKNGERWYVRFAWRTLQGRQYLTTAQALLIGDNDYYIRTLYTAVANNSMPSWRLEMDVLSSKELQTVDFDPFDVTRLWKNGTYETVPIGKLVLKEFSDNQFRDTEEAAFNPSNLVPGIPGPVDTLLRGRRFAYRDTQNYRVKRNHQNIGINSPRYVKTYKRDGEPPVGDNGDDSPNYYPNSFNGPIPFVDETRPKEELLILQSNAVDLQDANDFYNNRLPDDGARQRLVNNIVLILGQVLEKLRKRFVVLLGYVDEDLQRRVIITAAAFNITTGCEEKIANLTTVNPTGLNDTNMFSSTSLPGNPKPSDMSDPKTNWPVDDNTKMNGAQTNLPNDPSTSPEFIPMNGPMPDVPVDTAS